MSELTNSIIKKLIDDTVFLDIFERKIKEILSDGTITTGDIPNIMLLLLYTTNNLKAFNLTYDELTVSLDETIIYLLNKFNLIPESEKQEFYIMIHSCVQLIMIQPKVKNCIISIWHKITCKK